VGESAFFDQLMGQLQGMGLTGLRNFIGKTAATMPGDALGGEGGFRLDEEPLPFNRSPEQHSAAAQEMALNFMSPGMLVGRKAAERLGGSVLERFKAGEAATKSGMSPQKGWSEYGYAKGAEGKGRWEIDDQLAYLLKNDPKFKGVLEDALSHPELFKAYPELKKLPLDMRISALEVPGGSYSPSSRQLTARARNPEEARSVLMHELQHGVQDIEGFAPGTNLSKGLASYRNAAGEIEAENVQARLRDPSLMKWHPNLTANVPVEEQLVGQDSGALMLQLLRRMKGKGD